MKLVVKIVRHGDCGYRASCPALPGCSVSAETEEQARSRIRDAVVGYLASLDVALPEEPGANVVAEDVGLPDVPGSLRGRLPARAAESATSTGRSRGVRWEKGYART